MLVFTIKFGIPSIEKLDACEPCPVAAGVDAGRSGNYCQFCWGPFPHGSPASGK